jgi:hypothetical protein
MLLMQALRRLEPLTFAPAPAEEADFARANALIAEAQPFLAAHPFRGDRPYASLRDIDQKLAIAMLVLRGSGPREDAAQALRRGTQLADDLAICLSGADASESAAAPDSAS